MPSLADIRRGLFGERASAVELPPAYVAAQDRRRAFVDELAGQLRPGSVTQAERAAQLEADRQGDRLVQQQQAMASSGRGFGAVAARSQAMQNTAQGQADIGQGAAVAAARARAGEQARNEGMLAGLFGQDLELAMAAEEYRRQNARQGLFPTVAGIAGTIIGAKAGGVQGAQAGAQAGSGIGQAASELFR